MLAFHDFLNKNSPRMPGHLVVESPLHSFNEGKADPDSSMWNGLFQYLAEQAEKQQIVIIENMIHLEGLKLDESANKISFTKQRAQGRYGFLEGVYDIGEGKNECLQSPNCQSVTSRCGSC